MEPVPGVPLGRSHFGRSGWSAAALGFSLSFLITGGMVALGNGHHFDAPVVQPIAFNHKAHVQDREIDCSACHSYYEKQTFSGLPPAEVCAMCHAEPQGKSEEEAKLVRLLDAKTPLAWKPLFRQPPHVFYSHRRHVAVAKLECKECHGAIAEAAAPPVRAKTLRMQDCIDCHRRSGLSTHCTSCHR